MARRRKKKTLFTHKKLSKEKSAVGIPTDNEWKTLESYGTFVVVDDQENQHRFCLNETVFILPEGLLPDQKHHPTSYWIGRIKDIRSRNSEDVWARVQWYWSPSEVATIIKSFDVSNCGQYERIYSDYHDYVSIQSLCDHATMKRYEERNIEQEEFDSDHFFHRYNMEYRARRITSKVSNSACSCNVSYNPDRDTVMHFCPRPSCRLAFHPECLLSGKHKHSSEAARARQLLECWPDTDENIHVEELGCPRPRKRRKRSQSSIDLLEDFPEELVKAAQQQIVKGVQAGGVVGNVRAVVAARRLIYNTLLEGSTLPTDWTSQVDVQAAIRPLQENSKEFLQFSCPQCCSAI